MMTALTVVSLATEAVRIKSCLPAFMYRGGQTHQERGVFDCDVNERPPNRTLQPCFPIILQPRIPCI
jgi:hypothetical protein